MTMEFIEHYEKQLEKHKTDSESSPIKTLNYTVNLSEQKVNYQI